MRWKAVGIVALAFAGVQFLQPDSLPEKQPAALLGGTQAPDAVLKVLEKSCQDCHSWNTAWPWYSRISPVSWVIARDVDRGRKFLNFSEWSNYSRAQKLAFVAAMASAANQERMPPAPYLIMHPEARLTDKERDLIRSWSRTEFRRLSKRIS